VSTEGDAFLVAFHEPFDAVAWCLCVQLALHSELLLVLVLLGLLVLSTVREMTDTICVTHLVI